MPHLLLQLFFHDPENNMIELCNCDEFPVIFLNGLKSADVNNRRSMESDVTLSIDYSTSDAASDDAVMYHDALTYSH